MMKLLSSGRFGCVFAIAAAACSPARAMTPQPLDPLGIRTIDWSVQTAIRSAFWSSVRAGDTPALQAARDTADLAIRVASVRERVDVGTLWGALDSESRHNPKPPRSALHRACGVAQIMAPRANRPTENAPLTEDLYEYGPRYGFDGPHYIRQTVEKIDGEDRKQYHLIDARDLPVLIAACEDPWIGAGLGAAHLNRTRDDILVWTGRGENGPAVTPEENYGCFITGAYGGRNWVNSHLDPVKAQLPVSAVLARSTIEGNPYYFLRDVEKQLTVHIPPHRLPHHKTAPGYSYNRTVVVKESRTIEDSFNRIANRIGNFFNPEAFIARVRHAGVEQSEGANAMAAFILRR